jgi:predicted dithiol-disulfide oxidoreductase (DUF899 family)
MNGMDMGVETELGMMLPGAAVAVFRSASVRGRAALCRRVPPHPTDVKGARMTDRTIGTREEWLAARERCLSGRRSTRGSVTSWRGNGESSRGCRWRRSTASRPRRARRNAGRAVRRPLATRRLPLHVRAGLHGGLSDLFGDGRQLQRRAPAPRGRRRDDDLHLTRAAREAARLPAAHGWSFNWASSYESDFNFDFGVSCCGGWRRTTAAPLLEANEVAARPLLRDQGVRDSLPRVAKYNAAQPAPTWSATSPRDTASAGFARESDGVYHCYSSYARGSEFLMSYYAILDRTPRGREPADAIGSWVRRHDEYVA